MRFAADENFSGHILSGLLERIPNLDIVRVQDTDMYQAPDPELLGWLAQENRILLTHDINTIPGFAYERVEKGASMPGVIVVRQVVSIGLLLEELEVILGAGQPRDFENIVQYVPMN